MEKLQQSIFVIVKVPLYESLLSFSFYFEYHKNIVNLNLTVATGEDEFSDYFVLLHYFLVIISADKHFQNIKSFDVLCKFCIMSCKIRVMQINRKWQKICTFILTLPFTFDMLMKVMHRRAHSKQNINRQIVSMLSLLLLRSSNLALCKTYSRTKL